MTLLFHSQAKLSSWRDNIVSAFGPRPFLHPRVAQLLNSSYYARHIMRGRPLLQQLPSYGRARAVLNHTCNMSLGGPMPTRFANGPMMAVQRARLACQQY